MAGSNNLSLSEVLLCETFLQGLNMKALRAVDYGGNEESEGSFLLTLSLTITSVISTVVLFVPQIFLPHFTLQV